MKLGIFDSGIGSEAVAVSLRRAFPDAKIQIVNDKEHVPYGDKTETEVITLSDTAIQPLLAAHCDIIILACNTASALAIDILRSRYPAQLFIGLEPMIKPAAILTQSGIICICATPATLGSQRYHNLKQTYGSGITILQPDCSKWAYMIEHNRLNQRLVASTINAVCEAGADVIVLGCTHYHWIKDLIVTLAAGRAQVIDPSDAIARRVENLYIKS